MNLSAYSDSSPHLVNTECECGNTKQRWAEACARCLFLDGQEIRAGSRATQTDIISVLRGTDGLSLREICETLGIDTTTKNGQRGVYRQARELLATGRVRRYWRDTDVHIVEKSACRRKWGARGGSGCWVYILDGAAQ